MAIPDPWSLANVTTSDDYSAAATIADGPAVDYLWVEVPLNGAVYYQLEIGQVWQPEVFLGPWVGTLDEHGRGVTGIRFRSALAGQPGQVSARLVTAGGPGSGSVPGYTITPDGSVSSVYSLITGDVFYSAKSGARTGAVVCDGTFYDSVADPTFANLYAEIGTEFGGTGPSHFAVPDLRDRVVVGAGGNTALGANDGVGAGSRHATSHRHTAHSHPNSVLVGGSGAAGTGAQGNQQYTSTSSVDGGSGVATDPLDGPAFLGLTAYIVK